MFLCKSSSVCDIVSYFERNGQKTSELRVHQKSRKQNIPQEFIETDEGFPIKNNLKVTISQSLTNLIESPKPPKGNISLTLR